MTREEAEEIINRENDPNDKKFGRFFPEYREALDMAIKALSQEPCDDAISREDRLVDLANAIESDDSGYWTNKRISLALRNIEKLPSVTQMSGKWLYKEITDDYRVTGQCSECKERRIIDNFCPNCGAKMESEE